jgi:pimeloyl-ACP methyl ester carboxylesterase
MEAISLKGRCAAALTVALSFAAACGGGGNSQEDADGEDPALHDDPAGEDPAAPDDGQEPDEAAPGPDEPEETVPDTDGEEGWTPRPLEWVECTLIEGEDDRRAECADMIVPRRWGVEDGETFTVALKRIRSDAVVPDVQLWLLEGGPGGAGRWGWAPFMDFLHRYYPRYDAYTIDARGTGHSEFLACPADDAMRELDFGAPMEEVEHCIGWLEAEHGDDLDVFGTTPAARDLMAAIDLTRLDGVKVILYGNSAGTWWAQRFLALFPDAVDGAVLEANLSPDFFGGYQDESFENVTRRILELCAGDALCSTKLPDPLAAAQSLLASLEGGHCPELGWTAEDFLGLLGVMLYYRPYNQAIPAVIYRMARCGEADRVALEALVASLTWMPDADTGFSIAVFYNEYLSEMWDCADFATSAEFLAYLDELYAGVLFAMGDAYYNSEVSSMWPVYDDPLDGVWPETTIPLLILQGRLDPAAFYEQTLAMADHYTAPGQHYLDFPYASHGVIFGTPMGLSPFAQDCGLILFEQFMEDPAAPLDASCMAGAVPLDFEGTADAPSLMGTADFWE